MSERFKVTPSVFIAAVKDNQVLLQKRQNTGFYDGYFDLPSGHLEDNEDVLSAAKRELEEETGIVVHAADLELFHVCLNAESPGNPYLYHFFRTIRWSGEPIVGDPDKIVSVDFFEIDKLPANTTRHVVTALGDIASKKVGFSWIN